MYVAGFLWGWVVAARVPCLMSCSAIVLGHECTCIAGLRRAKNSDWPQWVDEASGADCSACSIAWEVV